MTEEELIINKRSGWTVGKDIVLSKINQIYYETREIETSGEESEGSGYKDFDISTLPAGAIRVSVYNLHGRSVGIVPILSTGSSEPVTYIAKESFAFYEIEGEEPEHEGGSTYPIIHCTLEDVPDGIYRNASPAPRNDLENNIIGLDSSLLVSTVGIADEGNADIVHKLELENVSQDEQIIVLNIITVPASERKTSGTLELRAAAQLSLRNYTVTADFSLSDQDLMSSVNSQISQHETGNVSDLTLVDSDSFSYYSNSEGNYEQYFVDNLRLAVESDIIQFTLAL